MGAKSVLMTRGCGCDWSLRALRNSRLAASASRKADNRKSIVAPAESTTRQIAPAAFDLKVGLVNAPRLVGGLEMPSYPQFQFGPIALHPTPHRRVIGCEAALQ